MPITLKYVAPKVKTPATLIFSGIVIQCMLKVIVVKTDQKVTPIRLLGTVSPTARPTAMRKIP